MINNIKNLHDFILYCHQLIIDEQAVDSPTEDWVLQMMVSNCSQKEILSDLKKTLKIYYSWLALAQEAESYYACQIIYQAITIENQHYSDLNQHLFQQPLTTEIAGINTQFKKKYL